MIPNQVPNWIGGTETAARSGEWFEKINPDTGERLTRAARSRAEDVEDAINSAVEAFPSWRETPAVLRGFALHKIVVEMQRRQEEIAQVVATETGKSLKDAIGETNAAIQCGLFYASEGQRLFGRTTTSGLRNKYAMTIRQPIGLAGLIIPANTPIANVAWKIFPALVCGNAAILKASEDTPATAWFMGKIALECGLPKGILNIVQGYGDEAGGPLVEDPRIGVISFTGSTEVGRLIQTAAGSRFTRVSLELGGKNAFLVCDDADQENAIKWILLSAFSNSGQRCASTSRIIVFDSIYDEFIDSLVKRVNEMKVGPTDQDDFGPVINEHQLNSILQAIAAAEAGGAIVLTGGKRLKDTQHKNGYYVAPTLVHNVSAKDEISNRELFGPVAIIYRVHDYEEGLALANNSLYGLTASIHTRSIHRAFHFCDHIETGVAVVNGGTFGSEPHMPFGGRKLSGNGSREPGPEALNIYAELKDIYINIDPEQL